VALRNPRANVVVVVEALSAFIDSLVRKLVLEVVASLVRAPSEGGTPVDTGWARANWIPVIGRPVSAPAGSREAVSQGEQQAGLAQVAAGYRARMGPVYISNAVPYIVRLNEGGSKQAPAGFVQAALFGAVGAAARGFGGRQA